MEPQESKKKDELFAVVCEIRDLLKSKQKQGIEIHEVEYKPKPKSKKEDKPKK
jgi:hypothetical protein